jgi:hypothetical protein
VDKRSRDSGLNRDAADPQGMRTFGDDHTARSAQDLVDAVARRTDRRLLDSRHPGYPD